MLDRINRWSVKKKFWFGLSVVVIVSFVWLYVFLSGLNFNPAYGDDYRSLYYAKSHSLKVMFLSLAQPFSKDYYGKGWVDVRPVHYFFLKGIYSLFKSEVYWYYVWRIITGGVFLTLVYLFFHKTTGSAFFSAAASLFILGLPSFYFTFRFIADQTYMALIFLMAALLFLLKLLETNSWKNLVLFLAAGYLSVKSKTDGKFLLPVTASLFLFSRRSLKIALAVFLFAFISIPWQSPFTFESLTVAEKETSFFQYLITVVFQKMHTDFPFGYEPSFVLFTKPFPISLLSTGQVTIPFSFLAALGPLFAWLFLLCAGYAIFCRFRKNQCFAINKHVFVILLTWFVLAAVLLALVGTKVHDVELPKYIFSGMLPFALLCFLLFHCFYSNCVPEKYRRIFIIIVIILVVHHLAAGLFYDFFMRGIEGQQWFVFDEAVKSVISAEGKSGDFIDVLYAGGEFDVVRRIIFEKYNFVIHGVLTQSALKQLMSENVPFYVVDLRHVNSNFNENKYVPADYEPVVVKEIFLPKDGLDGLYVKFKSFMTGQRDASSMWFARVYRIQKSLNISTDAHSSGSGA